MTADRHDDVVLGDSLAETAALNSPEQTAGRRAGEAVQRAVQGGRLRRRRRRAFAFSAALVIAVIAGLGLLLWRLAPPA